jgi:2-oxoglutarate dehydrogenase E1 component
MLLPHGFEGQGPEHSSARLERFLQLSGRQNLTVCNFTTPAQIFHALRRQVKRDFRKPLVVMSPKSLLRHPMAVSTIDEFTKGGFEEVLDDPTVAEKDRGKIKKVILCSGKVYYDLVAARTAKKDTTTAIIRLEQLYPWPEKRLAELLDAYDKAKTLFWVQEEPRNMGSWSYVFGQWAGGLGDFAAKVGGRMIKYVGRDVGAAPAVGSHRIHEIEQKELIEKALS